MENKFTIRTMNKIDVSVGGRFVFRLSIDNGLTPARPWEIFETKFQVRSDGPVL
jgi:hypothetical protein